jgi:hypothetical protein
MPLIATDKPSRDEQRYARLLVHNAALRDPITMETVAEIKRAFRDDDIPHMEILWRELTEKEQRALWIAPSYGGIFTTKEREVLNSFGLQWEL